MAIVQAFLNLLSHIADTLSDFMSWLVQQGKIGVAIGVQTVIGAVVAVFLYAVITELVKLSSGTPNEIPSFTTEVRPNQVERH